MAPDRVKTATYNPREFRRPRDVRRQPLTPTSSRAKAWGWLWWWLMGVAAGLWIARVFGRGWLY